MNGEFAMTRAEEMQINEIRRMRVAMANSESEYLKRDCIKAIRRLKKELAEYRSLYYGTKAE